jgi:predicted nucleic acid-binding protein
MVVVDASILLLLFRPDAAVPADRSGRGIARAKDRVDFLVTQLERDRTRILVPTPALAEVLVKADADARRVIVETLQRQHVFQIESFDLRAAIEVATMQRNDPAAKSRNKRMSPQATYAKLKYDRQIVAIAIVNQAQRIYSDDGDIRTLAQRAAIPVTALAELPLPPEDPNYELFSGSQPA